jgi:two-component system, NarL family, sensor histidine kinase DesK
VLWIQGPGRPIGLALILFLCIMSLARWRFALPAWTVLIDQAACAAVMQLWPQAAFALALPVFDATVAARPWLALPVIVILAAWTPVGLPLVAVVCCAGAAGVTVLLWGRGVARLRREADADRREKYELARLRDDLLVAGVQTARAAELAERARIARDLHDHLGHELTAAGLALQAFDQLWKEGDSQAGALLAQAERRIAEGMGVLRATVSGMAPRRELGVGGLEEICRTLSDPPPELLVHGNTDLVSPHAWSVLEPCLKEGLTNAVRHGEPGRVSVTLDVGPRIVRLCVHNAAGATGPRSGGAHGGARTDAAGATGARDADPGRSAADSQGLGLRSLRQRARAVGGSLTTDTTNGFRLICVLPLSAPSDGAIGGADGVGAPGGAP